MTEKILYQRNTLLQMISPTCVSMSTLCDSECAYLSIQFMECIPGVWGEDKAKQHTSLNDGLANGTFTLDKDKLCSWLVETAI